MHISPSTDLLTGVQIDGQQLGPLSLEIYHFIQAYQEISYWLQG